MRYIARMSDLADHAARAMRVARFALFAGLVITVLKFGIFYLTRAGCAWRMMPRDLPHWSTVHHYFRKWRKDGTLEQIHDVLRRQERQRKGRHPEASAGVLDSQSVKTSQKGG
jgi:transposase